MKFKDELTDITSEITFNETVTDATKFIKKGNMIYVNYQGENTTHNANDVLGTIPAKYRPKEQTFGICTSNADAYGVVFISSVNGEFKIGHFSSTSVTGRIYANFSYSIV